MKSRQAPRSSLSGSVDDLETVVASTNGRIPKSKKVSSTPTARQLRKTADHAAKAGIPRLAEKYEKVAADAARHESLRLENGPNEKAQKT